MTKRICICKGDEIPRIVYIKIHFKYINKVKYNVPPNARKVPK